LVILDTPGLNSLGTEPELTLNMLPNAQAVLFLLAADTGVTKSDMEVWTNHVCVAKRGDEAGRFAILNKIDTLWDELRTESSYGASLNKQVQDTAAVLNIPRKQIIPVSAQKGLIAKIKNDAALLDRSNLAELENRIATDLVGIKQTLVRDHVSREIGVVIDTTSGMIDARLSSVDKQLTELRTLSGKSQDTIQQMIVRMRKEKVAYDKTLTSFQTTRSVLSEQIKVLLDYLSMEAYDALMARARADMKDSWTTHGLRIGMKSMFDGMLDAMDKANKQTQQIRGLVIAIYNKFHADHGLARIKPVNFSLLNYRTQLQKLYEEAEAFRNSPVMVMTEAHFVIKKFFISLASRSRDLFNECNHAAKVWSKAVMAPILSQVREHKIMMDHRLENLKKIHENLDNLTGRMHELEQTKANLQNQLVAIKEMLDKINPPSTRLDS
jgi:hypothetical protein